MIQMLVKKSDNVDVDVFVYEKDDNILATHEKDQLPKDVENAETFSFTFRKPNYQDSNVIMSSMGIISGQTGNLAALMDFRLEVLRRLLDDWSLTDSDGKKIPCNFKNISSLQPQIAAASVDGCMERRQIS